MSDVHIDRLGPAYPERRVDRARSDGHCVESGFLEMVGYRDTEGVGLL